MNAPSLRRAGGRLVAGLPLLLLVAPLRHVLEARMLMHMAVEFPLLLAAGWALGERLRHGLDACDAHGLLGVTLSSAVAAFWMIPAALDASLLSPGVQAAKVWSWWLAGLLLARSRRRLADETRVFWLGNLAWMSATVGLLYQTAERRLCANYLVDDQQLAGAALVAFGLVLGGLAIRPLLRAKGLGFEQDGMSETHRRAHGTLLSDGGPAA
ncbi:MAG: hypothetical protein KF788_18260 [Piscinibacter sp.]|nr:hypothetical protein [Piscinibacter sp.]